jgi:hypothetical protein
VLRKGLTYYCYSDGVGDIGVRLSNKTQKYQRDKKRLQRWCSNKHPLFGKQQKQTSLLIKNYEGYTNFLNRRGVCFFTITMVTRPSTEENPGTHEGSPGSFEQVGVETVNGGTDDVIPAGTTNPTMIPLWIPRWRGRRSTRRITRVIRHSTYDRG